jgi:transcriptional regulator with XRE-family HTH domain
VRQEQTLAQKSAKGNTKKTRRAKNSLQGVFRYAYIIAMQIDLNNPNWLAVVMAYRGVKAADLAKQTGVSERTITQIKSGQSRGTLRILMKLAKALDLQIEARPA